MSEHGETTIVDRSGMSVLPCKYGENGWQTPAALQGDVTDDPLALHRFKVIAGTSPSYNNWCDIDRLLQTATHIAAAFRVNYNMTPPIALAVKHGNCCGAGVGVDRQGSIDAIRNMLMGDPRAIMGGLMMVNFPLTLDHAADLLHYGVPDGRRLFDGIIAPVFDVAAVKALERKGGKCRLIENPALGRLTEDSLDQTARFRYVRGGRLVQPNYTYVVNLQDERLERIGEGHFLAEELATIQKEFLIGWAIGSTSNSNTITLVSGGQLLANAVGQQDRVGAAELAVKKATSNGHNAQLYRSSAYSDSFFPFVDGPKVLLDAGVHSVFTSAGSIRYEEIKGFFKDNKMLGYFIPDENGRGFYGH